MKRKPNKRKPPCKFQIRSVKMSELSLEDQIAVRKGLVPPLSLNRIRAAVAARLAKETHGG